MTPIAYYQSKVETGDIFSDPEQLSVLKSMEDLHFQILAEEELRNSWRHFFRKPKLVKGLYLWGGVGIGKTFLMDCFFQTLPIEKKYRAHFYAFMQRVQSQLTSHQGEKEPLDVIAKELAQQYSVICFDEFFVSDITDAMVLGRLFKALFSRGVCLVATSNVPPDDLYKNGLQRSQFIPAINLLKLQTKVVHMPTSVDYRLRHLRAAGVFYTPLNAHAVECMQKTFVTLTQGQPVFHAPIIVNERPIEILGATDNMVWFEFSVICGVPRSQLDYLEIAKKYTTVLISNIPIIHEREKDKISLFITLIDVLYDAKVRLVASAEQPVDQLYQRGFLIMEYARTHSRLLEMQSEDYFAGEFKQII